jgi:hypothetical protein
MMQLLQIAMAAMLPRNSANLNRYAYQDLCLGGITPLVVRQLPQTERILLLHLVLHFRAQLIMLIV